MALATVTVTPLCGPTFDSKTTSLFFQLSFGGSDFYDTGGLPVGLQALAAKLGIDTAAGQFLQCVINGEETIFTGSFEVGGYLYHYCYPSDTVQIFTAAGTELTQSQLLPAAVLNDVVIGKSTWIRL
jgi:hypothetical protein